MSWGLSCLVWAGMGDEHPSQRETETHGSEAERREACGGRLPMSWEITCTECTPSTSKGPTQPPEGLFGLGSGLPGGWGPSPRASSDLIEVGAKHFTLVP